MCCSQDLHVTVTSRHACPPSIITDAFELALERLGRPEARDDGTLGAERDQLSSDVSGPDVTLLTTAPHRVR